MGGTVDSISVVPGAGEWTGLRWFMVRRGVVLVKKARETTVEVLFDEFGKQMAVIVAVQMLLGDDVEKFVEKFEALSKMVKINTDRLNLCSVSIGQHSDRLSHLESADEKR